MAIAKSVWGIDVGQCALKALKLRNVDGQLQVEAFDVIEHPRILSQPDADRKALIRAALEQFLARNNIVGSTVAVSVPGQASFTRFVKLPPVDAKQIPKLVQFEAAQQIPFPINDVIWRWQTFRDADSPDVELGIFAMKRVDVAEMLSHFSELEIGVNIVQMAPLGLYNFMTFDAQLAEDGATLLADVGADTTNLVVSDGCRIWTRTVQIGGNNFTEALVKAFKLSFAKAEKLKRTAASSKYARQIFQAMRPVFADLVQEIQRSVGHYSALHREARFKRLIGLGNGFRLPGLQKFLEQNLSIPVVRIDSYNKLVPSPTVNAPTFTENVLSFAVAYGLALQALEQTTVTTNLLPQEVARQRLWANKRPWFAASAAAILLTMGLSLYREYADGAALANGPKPDTVSIVKQLESYRREEQSLNSQGDGDKQQIISQMKTLTYRDTWPSILAMITKAMGDEFPQQWVFNAMGAAADDKAFADQMASLTKLPRSERQVFYLDRLTSFYSSDIDNLGATSQQHRPGFKITIAARTPLSQAATNTKMLSLRQKLMAMKTPPLEVLDASYELQPKIVQAVVVKKDPLFSEDTGGDTTFTITWRVAVTADGVVVPEEAGL